jgi:tetratricopeptide (TPR) repeat protein
MTARLKIIGLLALAAVLGGAGCGRDGYQATAETDEANYREGQQLNRQGRTQEALAAYLKVIAQRGDQAPESHLEVGLIYLEHIRDPIAAIYYFRKYLELEPNSRQAVFVRGLVDTAKREFARTLPGQPLENSSARLGQADDFERLQRENEDLRAELAELRAGGAPPAAHVAGGDAGAAAPSLFVAPAAPAPAPADEGKPPITPAPIDTGAPAAPEGAAPPAAGQEPAARLHTVVKGDTLYSLAQKYYGNRSKWRDILAANSDQLPKAATPLKIGMQLHIP